MYLIIAVFSYFITASANTLDKLILSSKKIPIIPSVYAFYTGILAIISITLYPLGFKFPEASIIFLSLLSGMLFTYGLLSFYYAIERGETSRIAPLTGVAMGISTFIASLAFLNESFNLSQLTGLLLLVVGGLIISYAKKGRKLTMYKGIKEAVLAGMLLALSFSMFKLVYNQEGFINGFIWTRFGLILGALSLLLIPLWRKEIFQKLAGFKKKGKKKETLKGLGFILLNKVLGGIGSILVNLAISIGSVVIVNAMVSVQYAFVFLLTNLLSVKYKNIYQEDLKKPVMYQKIMAIIVIGIGIVMVSIS